MVRTKGIIRPDAERLAEERRAGWRSPRSFTAFVAVSETNAGVLHKQLKELASDFQERLSQVSDLHSFRLCAIPASDSSQRPLSVLLNCVHDLPPETHLKRLIECTHDLLCRALDLPPSDWPADRLCSLLLKNRVREHTVHLGSIGRSVEQIHLEDRLCHFVKQTVADGIGQQQWNDNTPPETIHREVRDHVLNSSDAPTRRAAEPLSRRSRFRRLMDLLRTFLFFPFIGVLAIDIRRAIARISRPVVRCAAWLAWTLWWIYGALFTAFGFLLARFLERTEKESPTAVPDEELVKRLEKSENLHPKNAVTIVFQVKNTRIRRWYLSMILRGAELGCRHFWTNGKLTRIPTIHYARIIQIDNGRQMLFMSDYDGSLGRYLDDFLGIGRRAVLPFTSNLAGCPRTRWLFRMQDRTDFGPRWKRMIRRYQIETAVWYSAYPKLTVEEILNNAAQREELFADDLTRDQVCRWLRRL